MRLSEKKIGGIVGVLNRYQNALEAGKASDHLFGPHQAPTAPRAFSFDRAGAITQPSLGDRRPKRINSEPHPTPGCSDARLIGERPQRIGRC